MLKIIAPLLQIISSLAIAVLAIMIPLNLVLEDIVHSGIYVTLYIIISVILLIDFINNFLIYNSKKKDIENHSVLEEEHNTFFLSVDLIGLIPFGLFISAPFWAIIQLIKIIRIAQYQSFWNKRAVKFGDYQKLGFFAFWLTIITHWLACGWLSMHIYSGINDDLTLYIKSLYWAVVTLTTVGYGDIVPTTNYETIYSMAVMVFGVGVYGYVIGNVANILSKRDPAKMAFQENMESLKSFVKYRDLPTNLQYRVRDYYAYLWKKKLGYNEANFLSKLPTGLKHEVELYLKRKIVDKIPLFKEADENFLNDIALNLKPVVFIPGETIIKEGLEGHEMYLVVKGKVKVYMNETPDSHFILGEGSFVGEIALLRNVPRNANVVAVTYVDLYVLERKDFEHVLSQHKGIAKKIVDVAEARLEADRKKRDTSANEKK
jgi:Cyclic nucleotide-binding domain/Ion channel